MVSLEGFSNQNLCRLDLPSTNVLCFLKVWIVLLSSVLFLFCGEMRKICTPVSCVLLMLRVCY